MGVPHIIGPGVGPAKELKNKEEEREARELLKSLRIDFSLGRDLLSKASDRALEKILQAGVEAPVGKIVLREYLQRDPKRAEEWLKSMTYLSEVYREIAVEVISKKEKEV